MKPDEYSLAYGARSAMACDPGKPSTRETAVRQKEKGRLLKLSKRPWS